METVIPTNNTIQQSVQPQVQDLGHEKLLSCLYFVFDAFERCGMHFFLVRETATNANSSHMLEGDHIDIGVRENEWLNDQKDLLFAYLNEEHVQKVSELPKSITYKWNDVLFTIHIYPDNPSILALVPISYEHEIWMLPNGLVQFTQEYDH